MTSKKCPAPGVNTFVHKSSDNNDRAVKSVFLKHPNRALAVPEVVILLGGSASFNVADSFDRLVEMNEIYETASERHVGRTLGDEIVTYPRYRRAT